MPPTKENDLLTVSPDASSSASSGGRADEAASRPQPVALEVPVTVNGARTVVGSDKREPFSETTKTVLVFSSGAVIRLGSPVAPGQLLFLTNEKTKKEVVCQVVKSKNYRSASGYVELEFTESVVGFWGMRFPSDGAATPAPVRPFVRPSAGLPVTPGTPVAKGNDPTTASTTKAAGSHPLPAENLTGASVPPLDFGPKAPMPPAPESKNLPEAPATQRPEPPKAPVAGVSSSLATSLASLLEESEAEIRPASVATPGVPPQGKPSSTAGSQQTEELKLHTARLQEQLSSMLFNPGPAPGAASNTPAASSQKPGTGSNLASQASEVAKSNARPTAKVAPPPAKSGLDADEVKIPAWLEPLARNAAAPATTQQLIDREKAKHAAAVEAASREETSETALPITAVEPSPVAAPPSPSIGNLLPLDEEVLSEARPASGSRKGLVFGAIAAGLLAAAGGAWYFLQPTNGAQTTAAPFSSATTSQPHVAPSSLPPAQPVVQPAVQPGVPPSTELNPPIAARPVKPISSAADQPGTKRPAQPAPNVDVGKPPTNAQPAALTTKDNSRNPGAAIPAAEKERMSQPDPQPEPKKPVIGEVHLASPTMRRRTGTPSDADAPTLGPDGDHAGGLGSAFGSSGKQPAAPEAPLPVGGDVKPARLVSKVDPAYPSIAKSQHVSGEVVVDALIDATGHVTTMKVISGPTLLQQAAKDALHQWRYQPATLDGKPVAMHLTVRLQFRIQ